MSFKIHKLNQEVRIDISWIHKYLCTLSWHTTLQSTPSSREDEWEQSIPKRLKKKLLCHLIHAYFSPLKTCRHRYMKFYGQYWLLWDNVCPTLSSYFKRKTRKCFQPKFVFWLLTWDRNTYRLKNILMVFGQQTPRTAQLATASHLVRSSQG